jgi:isopentenyl-diphosphate delta-isomerase
VEEAEPNATPSGNTARSRIVQPSDTSRRKREQLDVVLTREVESGCGNGFERYRFVHDALPEIDLCSVSTATTFLGRALKLPLLIEAMTGGAPGTEIVNRNLAVAAERTGAAIGLGSQRAMLEESSVAYTYQVREWAPSVLLFGNIGAIQLRRQGPDAAIGLARQVGADGLVVHLNPAQEVSQEGGDTDWSGVLAAIVGLCAQAELPIVVKETGCGISGSVASRLERAGVAAIDVAGVGGTCWTNVEELRRGNEALVPPGWGIPTADALVECRGAVHVPLIASGGMRTGLDCAKALALGASLVGLALPLLKPALESAGAVASALAALGEQIRTIMFLVGAADLPRLRETGVARVD